MQNLLLVATCITSMLQPGALDSYIANCTSVKADVEFEFQQGVCSYELVRDGRLWTEYKSLAFVPRRNWTVTGKWCSDGFNISLLNTPPKEVVDHATDEFRKAKKTSGLIDFTPEFQLVTDGKTVGFHSTARPSIDLKHYNPDKLPSLGGRSPMLLWDNSSLTEYLRHFFPTINATKSTSQYGGRHLEVEVYRKEESGKVAQLEVFFDPAVGYLPRYSRQIVYSTKLQNATVIDKYILATWLCEAGGFVPTEWIELYFAAPNFITNNPNYQPGATIHGPIRSVTVGHLKASKYSDHSGPIVLENLNGVRKIASSGKSVNIKGKRNTLTLGQISQLYSDGLKSSSRTGNGQGAFKNINDHIDFEELRNQSSIKPTFRLHHWGLLAMVLAIVFWLSTRSKGFKRWFSFWIVICFILPGCGSKPKTVVKLSSSFGVQQVLSDDPEAVREIDLHVLNKGNIDITLVKIDGGCTCREVEQAKLPNLLRPGQTFKAIVKMRFRRQYDIQQTMFTLITDHGNFKALARLRVVPRFLIEPGSVVNNNLRENEDWSFNMIFREANDDINHKTKLNIKFPNEFKFELISEQNTVHTDIKGVQFKESKYKVSLISQKLGVQKAIIVASDDRGKSILETPLVWGRSAFMSTTPDRVVLVKQPVRIFLRCEDLSVEIIKVIKVPDGLIVTQVAPREVLVSLADGVSEISEGELVLLTTAKQSAILRIPIFGKASFERKN